MDKLDFRFLLDDSRARIYLLWAGITLFGYTATHYYQNKNINFVWFFLSVGGFYFMYKYMPLRVVQMKKIFLAWLIPISVGLVISIASARGFAFENLLAYLGVVWLIISAIGFLWNGLVDRPMRWYMAAAGLCLAGSALCLLSSVFLSQQYLVAAVISAWAMLNLFIFRTD